MKKEILIKFDIDECCIDDMIDMIKRKYGIDTILIKNKNKFINHVREIKEEIIEIKEDEKEIREEMSIKIKSRLNNYFINDEVT